MDPRWIESFGGPRDMATPLLCRACDRVSRWCRIYSDLNWGTGQPSISGMMIGQDMTI